MAFKISNNPPQSHAQRIVNYLNNPKKNSDETIEKTFTEIGNIDNIIEIKKYINENTISLNVINKNGESLINKVVNNNMNEDKKLNIIKFLFSKFVNPDKSNSDNITPLHICCYNNYQLILDFLLSKKCNPNFVNNLNENALHYACNGYSNSKMNYDDFNSMILKLLKYGCSVYTKNSNNKSFLELLTELPDYYRFIEMIEKYNFEVPIDKNIIINKSYDNLLNILSIPEKYKKEFLFFVFFEEYKKKYPNTILNYKENFKILEKCLNKIKVEDIQLDLKLENIKTLIDKDFENLIKKNLSLYNIKIDDITITSRLSFLKKYFKILINCENFISSYHNKEKTLGEINKKRYIFNKLIIFINYHFKEILERIYNKIDYNLNNILDSIFFEDTDGIMKDILKYINSINDFNYINVHEINVKSIYNSFIEKLNKPRYFCNENTSINLNNLNDIIFDIYFNNSINLNLKLSNVKNILFNNKVQRYDLNELINDISYNIKEILVNNFLDKYKKGKINIDFIIEYIENIINDILKINSKQHEKIIGHIIGIISLIYYEKFLFNQYDIKEYIKLIDKKFKDKYENYNYEKIKNIYCSNYLQENDLINTCKDIRKEEPNEKLISTKKNTTYIDTNILTGDDVFVGAQPYVNDTEVKDDIIVLTILLNISVVFSNLILLIDDTINKETLSKNASIIVLFNIYFNKNNIIMLNYEKLMNEYFAIIKDIDIDNTLDFFDKIQNKSMKEKSVLITHILIHYGANIDIAINNGLFYYENNTYEYCEYKNYVDKYIFENDSKILLNNKRKYNRKLFDKYDDKKKNYYENIFNIIYYTEYDNTDRFFLKNSFMNVYNHRFYDGELKNMFDVVLCLIYIKKCNSITVNDKLLNLLDILVKFKKGIIDILDVYYMIKKKDEFIIFFDFICNKDFEDIEIKNDDINNINDIINSYCYNIEKIIKDINYDEFINNGKKYLIENNLDMLKIKNHVDLNLEKNKLSCYENLNIVQKKKLKYTLIKDILNNDLNLIENINYINSSLLYLDLINDFNIVDLTNSKNINKTLVDDIKNKNDNIDLDYIISLLIENNLPLPSIEDYFNNKVLRAINYEARDKIFNNLTENKYIIEYIYVSIIRSINNVIISLLNKIINLIKSEDIIFPYLENSETEYNRIYEEISNKINEQFFKVDNANNNNVKDIMKTTFDNVDEKFNEKYENINKYIDTEEIIISVNKEKNNNSDAFNRLRTVIYDLNYEIMIELYNIIYIIYENVDNIYTNLKQNIIYNTLIGSIQNYKINFLHRFILIDILCKIIKQYINNHTVPLITDDNIIIVDKLNYLIKKRKDIIKKLDFNDIELSKDFSFISLTIKQQFKDTIKYKLYHKCNSVQSNVFLGIYVNEACLSGNIFVTSIYSLRNLFTKYIFDFIDTVIENNIKYINEKYYSYINEKPKSPALLYFNDNLKLYENALLLEHDNISKLFLENNSKRFWSMSLLIDFILLKAIQFSNSINEEVNDNIYVNSGLAAGPPGPTIAAAVAAAVAAPVVADALNDTYQKILNFMKTNYKFFNNYKDNILNEIDGKIQYVLNFDYGNNRYKKIITNNDYQMTFKRTNKIEDGTIPIYIEIENLCKDRKKYQEKMKFYIDNYNIIQEIWEKVSEIIKNKFKYIHIESFDEELFFKNIFNMIFIKDDIFDNLNEFRNNIKHILILHISLYSIKPVLYLQDINKFKTFLVNIIKKAYTICNNSEENLEYFIYIIYNDLYKLLENKKINNTILDNYNKELENLTIDYYDDKIEELKNYIFCKNMENKIYDYDYDFNNDENKKYIIRNCIRAARGAYDNTIEASGEIIEDICNSLYDIKDSESIKNLLYKSVIGIAEKIKNNNLNVNFNEIINLIFINNSEKLDYVKDIFKLCNPKNNHYFNYVVDDSINHRISSMPIIDVIDSIKINIHESIINSNGISNLFLYNTLNIDNINEIFNIFRYHFARNCTNAIINQIGFDLPSNINDIISRILNDNFDINIDGILPLSTSEVRNIGEPVPANPVPKAKAKAKALPYAYDLRVRPQLIPPPPPPAPAAGPAAGPAPLPPAPLPPAPPPPLVPKALPKAQLIAHTIHQPLILDNIFPINSNLILNNRFVLPSDINNINNTNILILYSIINYLYKNSNICQLNYNKLMKYNDILPIDNNTNKKLKLDFILEIYKDVINQLNIINEMIIEIFNINETNIFDNFKDIYFINTNFINNKTNFSIPSTSLLFIIYFNILKLNNRHNEIPKSISIPAAVGAAAAAAPERPVHPPPQDIHPNPENCIEILQELLDNISNIEKPDFKSPDAKHFDKLIEKIKNLNKISLDIHNVYVKNNEINCKHNYYLDDDNYKELIKITDEIIKLSNNVVKKTPKRINIFKNENLDLLYTYEIYNNDLTMTSKNNYNTYNFFPYNNYCEYLNNINKNFYKSNNIYHHNHKTVFKDDIDYDKLKCIFSLSDNILDKQKMFDIKINDKNKSIIYNFDKLGKFYKFVKLKRTITIYNLDTSIYNLDTSIYSFNYSNLYPFKKNIISEETKTEADINIKMIESNIYTLNCINKTFIYDDFKNKDNFKKKMDDKIKNYLKDNINLYKYDNIINKINTDIKKENESDEICLVYDKYIEMIDDEKNNDLTYLLDKEVVNGKKKNIKNIDNIITEDYDKIINYFK